ncbi:hypothetical protein [Candidatus Protofrankia datiscae]|uniref:Uncharacterized protein n=1 Tax=Candidatus Protofrankia datiscae TaxID=2716812 RepID=F8B0C8_9ACTN|nr:hypothetical protein [Candidatus Protofrankia datiscae]AEH08754.1 hypothetical protein FsymDg_1269 [Candidatus Protofrankia datiscae]
MAARRRPVSATEIARQIAEDVRALNYATLPADGYPGLAFPGDVYDVLGALGPAVVSLTQGLNQLATFLQGQARRPGLHDTSSPFAGRPTNAITAATVSLATANQSLRSAAALLGQAQQDIAGLAVLDT